MCGRFTSLLSPELLASVFRVETVPPFPPRYNIAPMQQVHIVRENNGAAALSPSFAGVWCRTALTIPPSATS